MPDRSADGGAPLPAFSVLLPVYGKDRADFLRAAFESVTTAQSLEPNEVVIVRDGPVPAELAAELERIERESAIGVRVVALAKNVGLADALNAGLEACTHDVVARQDADDVSLPGRFALQLPLLAEGYELVGGAIREFVDDDDADGLVRAQPCDSAEIAKAARFRDPFNHPTVVYRKSAVAAAGGYESLALMEDYLLFARMIHRGARTCNVPDVLVRYRIGAGAYARRGGRDMARSELELQRKLRREGFLSGGQYVRNRLVRWGYRFLPESLRRVAYRRFVVRSSASSASGAASRG